MQQQQETNKQQTSSQGEAIDVKKIILQIWQSKWWYILSGVVLLAAAVLYVKITSPVYEISATIAVEEESSGSLLSGSFGDFGMGDMFGGNSDTEDEIEALKSKNLIRTIIRSNDLYLRVEKKELLRNVLYYKDAPIQMAVSDMDMLVDTTLTMKVLSPTQVEIKNGKDSTFTYKLGTSMPFIDGTLLITATEQLETGDKYTLIFREVERMVEDVSANLSIIQIKKTNAVTVTYRDAIKQRGIDFVNDLIDEYNAVQVGYDRRTGEKTMEFITDRLDVINEELLTIESDAELFKRDNELTDIVLEATILGESRVRVEQEVLVLKTQLQTIEYVAESLAKEGVYELLPENASFNETSLNMGITMYNELVLRRSQILQNAGETNPLIKTIDIQLQQMSQNIQRSMDNAKATLTIQLAQLEGEQRKVDGRITSAPTLEKEYRSIARRQLLTEQIYIYLLQKKEETEIAMIGLVGNIKMIDDPVASRKPVSPRPLITLFIAMVVAFIIPTAFVFGLDYFDDKVRSKTDIVSAGLPFLGSVLMEGSKKDKNYHFCFDNRIRFECFSLVRENLKYSVPSDSSIVLLVTSSIPGEGKSFCSSNLAYNYASVGKKVLLIGSDMRKPTLHKIFGLKMRGGLSEYLAGIVASPNDAIQPSGISDNLSIMTAGSIPPNPTVLLNTPRMTELIEFARNNYDVLVIDAAPVMAVPDPIVLTAHSNAVVYVSGAGVLPKVMLEEVTKFTADNKLNKVGILLNQVKASTNSNEYHYGYGYGMEEDNKKKRKRG